MALTASDDSYVHLRNVFKLQPYALPPVFIHGSRSAFSYIRHKKVCRTLRCSSGRTEEELGRVLEERKLTFLLPLLHIRAEIWRQLEAEPTTEAFMAWLEATVPAPHQTDPAFILALVHNILRFVTERAGEANDAATGEKEKEMIVNFKPVLQAFIKNSPNLQLTAVYAMQVGLLGYLPGCKV
jgi:hypothetical protein